MKVQALAQCLTSLELPVHTSVPHIERAFPLSSSQRCCPWASIFFIDTQHLMPPRRIAPCWESDSDREAVKSDSHWWVIRNIRNRICLSLMFGVKALSLLETQPLSQSFWSPPVYTNQLVRPVRGLQNYFGAAPGHIQRLAVHTHSTLQSPITVFSLSSHSKHKPSLRRDRSLPKSTLHALLQMQTTLFTLAVHAQYQNSMAE